MFTIYSIKPYFQKLLKPLIAALARMGATPNQVTVFAVCFSMGAGLYFAWAGPASWWLMPAVLLFRMALNAVDGMLARDYRLQSKLGTYLNEMGDIISDLFLFLPFLIQFPWSMVVVSVLSVLSEVAGILAAAVGKERRYDGPMGKSDRAFCLSVMGFLMAFGWVSDLWAAMIFGSLSLLLSLTIYFRIKKALA